VSAPAPKGDKPRKVIVCSREDYPRIQKAVTTELGHADVLVQPNGLVEPGSAYVIDGRLWGLPEHLFEPEARWFDDDVLMEWRRS
jgi:hypothetical protein